MNQIIKILFVDDEARVLDGLQRMLRPMRKEWDMTFVNDSTEVLGILQHERHDIIVSDMRMPGINGAQLLKCIKKEFPHMIRIALSGQSSKKEIMNSVGPVHQYLPKPCNSDRLKATIKQVCSLQEMITNTKLKDTITQLESLPCLSTIYTELIEELHSDDSSINDIAHIITKDVGMSVKILQLVNSAFFGVRHHVTGIPDAVKYLGLDTIKTLVLSEKIFSQFDQKLQDDFPLNSLWEHSYNVAKWAKAITNLEHADPKYSDYAMIAGMLHDVGKLVLAANIAEYHTQVTALIKKNDISYTDAEKEIIGVTHAEVGAYLLGLWGFGQPIINALMHHHNPSQSDTDDFAILTAIHASDALVCEINKECDNKSFLDTQYLENIHMRDNLDSWRNLCPDHLNIHT